MCRRPGGGMEIIMKNGKNWRGALWVLPSLAGVSVFYFVPYLDVVRRSVTQNSGESFAGAQNFRDLFQNEAFLLAGANTLRFMAVCIPLLLAVSLLLAAVVLRCRLAGFYKWVFLLPMALPAVSVALVWKLVFHGHGILNALPGLFGRAGTDWLHSPAAFGVMVVSYLWRNTGYNMILWMAGIRQIDGRIYEAARIDGANERQVFTRIMLPNLKQILYTVSVLSLLNSFKVFREAYLVAGSYPDDSMYMMQHLFNNWFGALALDKMSAASVLLSLVILAFILGLYRVWGKEMG